MATPDFVRARLADLHARSLHRAPPTIQTSDGLRGRVDGRPATLFCSNDYLGLRLDPRVTAAAGAAAEREGAGAGSSRLIAGSLPIHRQLEEALADWMGTEAALVFPSGYQANLALLGALAGRNDLLVSDALNHASLIDGCRLSRAMVSTVSHGDVTAAQSVLRGGTAKQRFVVGEGLYSMDGDRGPVAGWLAAAEAVGAYGLVDEAHAVGVLGPEGRGVCAEQGVQDSPALLARIGTFGKALGAHGAFVATDAGTRDLLVNTGRSYVFTTGLPPACAGAALASLAIVRSDEGAERRGTLRTLAERLARGAVERGHDLGGYDLNHPTPIVPVLLGDPDRALAVSAALLDAGYYARAIRPPTVPAGTSRIRFTLCANHSASDVDGLLDALGEPAP